MKKKKCPPDQPKSAENSNQRNHRLRNTNNNIQTIHTSLSNGERRVIVPNRRTRICGEEMRIIGARRTKLHQIKG